MEESSRRDDMEEEEEEVYDHEKLAKWLRWARCGVVFASTLNRAVTFGNYYATGILLLPLLCRFQAGRAATGEWHA